MTYDPIDANDDGTVNADVDNDSVNTEQASINGPLDAESATVEEAVIGVDPSDGPSAVEDAVNALPQDGGTVNIRRGVSTWTDRVQITRDNVTIEMSPGTRIIVDDDGTWTRQTLDPNPEIAEKKAVFVVDGSSNVHIEGGHIDGDGFIDDGDGDDAAGVLFFESEDCTLKNCTIENVFPAASMGPTTDSVDGNEVSKRYQAAISVKSENIRYKGCTARNIQYDAFSCRVACRDIRMSNCHSEGAFEGFQATTRYGSADADDPDDRFCEEILMTDSFATQCGNGPTGGAGFVTHAKGTKITDNSAYNNVGYGISIRQNGDESLAANNTITQPETDSSVVHSEGRIAINLSAASGLTFDGNTIRNHKYGFKEDSRCRRTKANDNTVVNCSHGYYQSTDNTPENETVIHDNVYDCGQDTLVLDCQGMDVKDNLFKGGNADIDPDRTDNGDTTGIISHNTFRGDFIAGIPDGVELRDNYGDYIQDNRGRETQSGDGTTTSFSWNHGLARNPSGSSGLEPEYVNVDPASADARGEYHTEVDDSQITVVYNSAPADGTDNLEWFWQANFR